ncbi:MAG TPA: GNAT family N-acetyltransferase [Ktedonosporobacter sp.]|nr:GNAT family N-acetyltransferase [Ktedonosporobacter sp.]
MQKTAWTIQPYDTSNDADAVFALWQSAVGQYWPIEMRRFRQVLSGPFPQHFVAKENGQVIGFVATARSLRGDVWTGHLLALLVAPSWQRKGLGSALYEEALQYLRLAGMRYLQLGGLSPRFWCGVPVNLVPAQSFFRAREWDLSGTVYDLVQDLHHYATPPAIYRRMTAEHIAIEAARKPDVEDILSFEQREFPNWLMHYQRCARLGDYQDLLVARDQQDGRVVGTTLMYTSASHPERTDVIWQPLLGKDAGAMGAVGVASSERGRGIGIALVARASDLLKGRGVGNCYIDWVELTDFYAKLGYEKWRSYHTSWREL